MKRVHFLPRSRALPAPQRGVAVLLALLTLALVTGLAAAAFAELGVAIDALQGRHDQAQARQLARGAVDWARNVLSEDARTSAVDHLGEAWAIRIPPTPVDDGEVGGEIQDLSGRINLNDLLAGGTESGHTRTHFQGLLQIIGVAPPGSTALTNALLDWLDADDSPRQPGGAESGWYAQQDPPRRPGNAPLVSVEELLQVRGFDAGLLARLAPFVAALPADTRINVNTAAPEVLAAIVPGLGVDGARVLVAERERAWFRDLADFKARLPRSGAPGAEADLGHLATTSRHFLVTGRARYGVSMIRMEALLDRHQNWADILWLRLP